MSGKYRTHPSSDIKRLDYLLKARRQPWLHVPNRAHNGEGLRNEDKGRLMC